MFFTRPTAEQSTYYCVNSSFQHKVSCRNKNASFTKGCNMGLEAWITNQTSKPERPPYCKYHVYTHAYIRATENRRAQRHAIVQVYCSAAEAFIPGTGVNWLHDAGPSSLRTNKKDTHDVYTRNSAAVVSDVVI